MVYDDLGESTLDICGMEPSLPVLVASLHLHLHVKSMQSVSEVCILQHLVCTIPLVHEGILAHQYLLPAPAAFSFRLVFSATRSNAVFISPSLKLLSS